MAHIEVGHEFRVSATLVWRWIGNTGGVADWIPAINSSRLEGDIRHVVFVDGEPARERIVHFDDDHRTYSYEYMDGPLPLEHYRSTIAVIDNGDSSCRVRWSAEFGAESGDVETELATAIESIYASALDELSTKVVPV